MNHVLGETSYLVRGLVVAIRPSIAWRLGTPVPPLDNLTQDGSLGWHLGLRSVLRRNRREKDQTPDSVISWLSSQALDQQRRRIPVIDIVEALKSSVDALSDDLLAMDTAEFVSCWRANIADSAQPRAGSERARKLGHLASETIDALREHEGTESLTTALHAISLRTVSGATQVSGSRSVSSVLTQPRLHPPLEHRQDWLDVLTAPYEAPAFISPALS